MAKAIYPPNPGTANKMAVLLRPPPTRAASAQDPTHLRRPKPTIKLQTRHDPRRSSAQDQV